MMHPALNPMQEKSSRFGWSFWLRVSAPLFVVCLLLIAGLLAGRASNVQAEEGAVPDAPGSITGVARGPGNAPAANIWVELYRRDDYGGFSYPMRTTVTAADGSYRFGLLGVGIYRVRFSDPAQQLGSLYYPAAPSLSQAQDIPVAGNNVANIDATLPQAGGISGSVTVPPSGQVTQYYYPLYVFKEADQLWDTVAYTYFVLTPMTPTVNYIVRGITPGVYKVCAYDYSSAYYVVPYRCYDNVAAGIQYASDVAVTAGAVTEDIDIIVDGDADLASISGRVTSLQGGALPTVTVELLRRDSTYYPDDWIYFRTTTTDASGDYTFTRLSPDAYKLRFTDHPSGHIQEYYNDVSSVEAATPITVARYEKRAGIDASLTPGGVITGQVTIAGETMESFAGVYASPVNNNYSYCCYTASTDSVGNYRISGLPPGVYIVAANGYLIGDGAFFNGYYGGADYASAKPITISGAATIPNIDIDLGQGAFEALIAGRVTNSQNQPLSGIQVEIYRNTYAQWPFYAAATDADGHYSIDGLVDGSYHIGFRDPANVYANEFYNDASRLFEANYLYPTGSTPLTQVNASLLRTGGVSGRAIYTDGVGAPNVSVSLHSDSYYLSEPIAYTTTDASGVYSFSRVRAGKYVVSFYDPQHPYGPYFYHQRLDYYQADRIVVEEGAITPNIDQVIGGAPTALDVENEPQAPTSARMYLPLVAR